MLGLRTEFVYLECRNCGSLRIAEIPPDLERYYPVGAYYSFSDGFRWRVFARRAALKTAATSRWLLGFLNRAFQIQVVLLMHSFGFEPSMRILDVGSGSGSLIRDLRSAGFKYAMGVDRFVASDIQENGGLIVKRGTLSEVEGNWDRIILNHSLEHMPDHLGVLSELRAKLSQTVNSLSVSHLSASHGKNTEHTGSSSMHRDICASTRSGVLDSPREKLGSG